MRCAAYLLLLSFTAYTNAHVVYGRDDEADGSSSEICTAKCGFPWSNGTNPAEKTWNGCQSYDVRLASGVPKESETATVCLRRARRFVMGELEMGDGASFTIHDYDGRYPKDYSEMVTDYKEQKKGTCKWHRQAPGTPLFSQMKIDDGGHFTIGTAAVTRGYSGDWRLSRVITMGTVTIGTGAQLNFTRTAKTWIGAIAQGPSSSAIIRSDRGSISKISLAKGTAVHMWRLKAVKIDNIVGSTDSRINLINEIKNSDIGNVTAKDGATINITDSWNVDFGTVTAEARGVISINDQFISTIRNVNVGEDALLQMWGQRGSQMSTVELGPKAALSITGYSFNFSAEQIALGSDSRLVMSFHRSDGSANKISLGAGSRLTAAFRGGRHINIGQIAILDDAQLDIIPPAKDDIRFVHEQLRGKPNLELGSLEIQRGAECQIYIGFFKNPGFLNLSPGSAGPGYFCWARGQTKIQHSWTKERDEPRLHCEIDWSRHGRHHHHKRKHHEKHHHGIAKAERVTCRLGTERKVFVDGDRVIRVEHKWERRYGFSLIGLALMASVLSFVIGYKFGAKRKKSMEDEGVTEVGDWQCEDDTTSEKKEPISIVA